MLICIDTETDGLIKDRLPPDHPSQPNLVQLGCILCDDDGKERAVIDIIVRPEGYTIPEQASNIHGITTETALRCGVPLVLAVGMFLNLRALATTIVAHNLPFDERVLQTAIHRTGRKVTLPSPPERRCTMEMAEPILKLPATDRMKAAGYGDKFKKPNLGECYQHFFNEPLEGAHSALIDARACARVYFAMVQAKELEDVGA